MSHEETFPQDLSGQEELERELLRLSTRLAQDLRRHRFRARTVTVKLRDSDFKTRQASRTLAEAVQSDRPIYETARELLETLRRKRRVPARLIGIAAAELVRPTESSAQLSLFDTDRPLETDRDRRISEAVDSIVDRYGKDGIQRGAELPR